MTSTHGNQRGRQIQCCRQAQGIQSFGVLVSSLGDLAVLLSYSIKKLQVISCRLIDFERHFFVAEFEDLEKLALNELSNQIAF